MRIASVVKNGIAVFIVLANTTIVRGSEVSIANFTLSSLKITAEKPAAENQASKPAFETLRGNGTKAGYILSHGSVIPGSESVTVAGSKKTRGKDYHIDYASGSLMFTEAVSQVDAIRVAYRHSIADTGERTLVGLPGLNLAPGKNTSMNLTYAYRVSDRSSGKAAADMVTYGLSTTTKLGGRSKLTSLMYTSSPKDSGSVINELAPKKGKVEKKQESKSGGIMVQDADLNLGKVNVKLGYQNVSKDFNGFSALRESKAAPAEVLDRLEKEKGLKRTNLALQFGDSDTNKLTLGSINDASGSISTKALGYAGKNYGVSIYKRSTDQGFNRLGDLSFQEKTDMALMVRQQFDQSTTAAQVTDADRAALTKEVGIDRSNIRTNFKSGGVNTSFQNLNISDGEGDIERNSVSFQGKDFSITWMRQSISDRFGKLAQLAPVEQSQFGNERGMDRTQISGSGKLGKTDVGLSFSRVSDKEGSVSKKSLSFKGKNFDVKANVQDISPDFKRSMDLADPDKKQMAAEQGYKKTDLTANIKLSDSVSVENFYLRMHNSSEGLDKNRLRNKLTFTPGTKTKITLFRDSYSFRSKEGNINSYLHQNFALDQKLGSLQFNGFRDTRSVTGEDDKEQTTTTTFFHLESDRNKRSSFSLDNKTIEMGEQGRESTRTLSVRSRPMGNLQLKSSMTDIDRTKGPDEKHQNYSMQWQINKDMKATADIAKKEVENTGSSNATSYSLTGKVADEILGMKDVKLSANFNRETENGNIKKQNNKVSMDAKIFDGNAGWELLQGRASDGSPTTRRGIRFVSNRDKNKWLHFDIGYAVRDTGPGDPFVVRNYNVDMKLNSNMSLTYNYFSYIEKKDGKVEEKGGSVIKLSSVLNKRLNLVAEYGTSDDYINRLSGAKLSLGIKGTLSNGAKFEFFYGMNELSGPSGEFTEDTFKLIYDRQVDADHYLSFSGVLTLRDNSNPTVKTRNEAEARLDFKTLFH